MVHVPSSLKQPESLKYPLNMLHTHSVEENPLYASALIEIFRANALAMLIYIIICIAYMHICVYTLNNKSFFSIQVNISQKKSNNSEVNIPFHLLYGFFYK